MNLWTMRSRRGLMPRGGMGAGMGRPSKVLPCTLLQILLLHLLQVLLLANSLMSLVLLEFLLLSFGGPNSSIRALQVLRMRKGLLHLPMCHLL